MSEQEKLDELSVGEATEAPEVPPLRPGASKKTPAEVDEDLVRLIVTQVLTQALSAVPITEEVVDLVRRQRVSYLRDEHGASIRTTARHLGVTDRNITQLQQPRAEGEPEEETLYSEILYFVISRFPDAVTSSQVRTALREVGKPLPLPSTISQLELLCSLDLIHKVGTRYRARYYAMTADKQKQQEHLQMLAKRLESLWPIMRSFGHAEPGSTFSRLQGEMDVESLQAFGEELRQFIELTLPKYHAMSNAKESAYGVEMVKFAAIFAMGMVPKLTLPPKD